MALWASKQYKKLIECERFRGYEGELPNEIYIEGLSGLLLVVTFISFLQT